MSLIFEAVVFEVEPVTVQEIFDSIKTPPAIRFCQVDARGFVVFSRLEPGRLFRSEHVLELAESLSSYFGVAVAVQYDDRGGAFSAAIFHDGALAREFGEKDEVWVPMDEGGNPLCDGPHYPGDALPPDEECDCIRNLIDAGLEAAGFGSWIDLSGLRQFAWADRDEMDSRFNWSDD